MKDFDFDFALDLDAFDFGRVEQLDTRYKIPRAFRSAPKHTVKYEHARDLVADISENILAGETIHALLSGNFIFGDVLEAFAVDNNLFIDSLQISTLSFGAENVDSLANLLDGDYLGKLDVIVSDYFWSHNRQNAPYIYTNLDKDDKFQLAVAGTHTKVTLMRIGDKKIVISGSANLRSSRCIEEITIQTCDELYDFHHAWQSVILEEYATIKKPIRGGDLFGLITKNTEGKKAWLLK